MHRRRAFRIVSKDKVERPTHGIRSPDTLSLSLALSAAWNKRGPKRNWVLAISYNHECPRTCHQICPSYELSHRVLPSSLDQETRLGRPRSLQPYGRARADGRSRLGCALDLQAVAADQVRNTYALMDGVEDVRAFMMRLCLTPVGCQLGFSEGPAACICDCRFGCLL